MGCARQRRGATENWGCHLSYGERGLEMAAISLEVLHSIPKREERVKVGIPLASIRRLDRGGTCSRAQRAPRTDADAARTVRCESSGICDASI